MAFELRLERAAPPLTADDPRAVALAFLRKVGVVGQAFDPLEGQRGAAESAPVAALVDCLMAQPERSFSAAEVAAECRVPVGQVYRALVKFEALLWVAPADEAPKGALPGKRYRLRFGSLAHAWRFTALAADECLARYAALARALEAKAAPQREAPAGKAPRSKPEGLAAPAREAFVMRLCDEPLPRDGAAKELAAALLVATGVIPQRTGGRKPTALPAFRLFHLAFVMGGERWWTLEELAKQAPSTRATLTKHVRRLAALDLLERGAADDQDGVSRQQFRLRHGSVARAFEYTDARARLALDSMGRWAGHLDALTQGEREAPRRGQQKARERAP